MMFALNQESLLIRPSKAKAKGVYKGRKPVIDVTRIIALKDAGMPPAVIARELKVARSSVYRALDKVDA
jgi:DNA invertase Pin-like site-specific DNA recombinase